LLSDLVQFKNLKTICESTIKELKQEEENFFQMWLETLENKILTKEIDFDLQGKLIDLDLDDGKM